MLPGEHAGSLGDGQPVFGDDVPGAEDQIGERRQGDEPESEDTLSFDAVRVDVARREVTVDGDPIHLTTKEFDLLAHMAANPGRIFSRDQLLTRIWGYDYEGDGRTVDVHISWLRGKLKGRDGHNYFRTVRGVGYAFAPRAT